MLNYYKGTVFNSPAKTLVNTVNCFGVMGAGIALEFRLRYPDMYKDYKSKCVNKEIAIGRPKLYKHSDELWIMNFPTKNHWRNPSKLDYIEQGLQYFIKNYKRAKIDSIAFPKLGTNKGGLPWSEVKVIMEKYLSDLDIDIYICLDELSEAEGIELDMVRMINNTDIENLAEIVKLTSVQVTAIKNSLPVKRFWFLSNKKGIGSKTYGSLFDYFYKAAMYKKYPHTSSEVVAERQLDFF